MRVVVPFAPDQPKTRLSDVLTPRERREFASAMLSDVVVAVRDAGHNPVVLSTTAFDDVGSTASHAHVHSFTDDPPAVVVDDSPLSEAVNSILTTHVTAEEAVAVVMSDLPLATPTAIRRLLDITSDIAIAPGRGGGTNALVVRHPEFRVDYHGLSFRDHLAAARSVGATVETVDSFHLATDVDEPSDLPEVALHSDGSACEWLVRAGFEFDVQDGRVSLYRE